MAVEPEKAKCIATWWEDRPEVELRTFIPDTEEVEIEMRYEEDCFFIDGLRDGLYLTIPLHGFAESMALGTAPAKGLAS